MSRRRRWWRVICSSDVGAEVRFDQPMRCMIVLCFVAAATKSFSLRQGRCHSLALAQVSGPASRGPSSGTRSFRLRGVRSRPQTSSASSENEEETSRPRRFEATCAGGLEKVLAKELRDAGAQKVQEFSRCVKFTGPASIGCRALVVARTVAAVDEVLAEAPGPLRSKDDLYNFVRQAQDWPTLIPPEETIRVGIIIATRDVAEDLRHTHYSTLTVSKAITDACRDATGVRPSVDLIAPHWMLHLLLHRGGAKLARRWSGPRGLHRRGYRAGVKMHKAALRETTAAGVLLLAGLQTTGQPLRFMDPMCGSGTLVLEAAMIALGVTPGVVRDALVAPDEPWHAVPREFHGLLAEEIARARARQCVPGSVMFQGSDAYPGALALARRCLAALERVMPGISQVVQFQVRVAAACARGDQNSAGIPHLLCCNPPWGDRLDGVQPAVEGKIEDPSTQALSGAEEGREALGASWRDLGELARRFFGNVWILNPVSLSPELKEEFHNAAYRQGAALTKAEQYLVDGGIRRTASHGKLGLEWSRIVNDPA